MLRLPSAERLLLVLALAAAALLAWWWLVRHSAAGGAAMEGMAMSAPATDAGYVGAAFAMWALMMVAMMLPSASPMILLYARFAARSGASLLPAVVLATCYLGIWIAFSAAAALAQALLVGGGAVSAAALALGDRRLAAVLLLLAALYQVTPVKRACLDQCRSPFSFLIRLWRPGLAGAARLGLAHGVYCLGCCWALMALLFVGGVMNLAWIALLAAAVAAEKLAPPRWRVDRWLALLLALGAAALLAA